MKLDYKRTFFVGLAFMSISLFWQIYDGVIPLILRDSFGVGDTVSGAVMAADNVLALFMLPFFGSLSDRTRSRFGRRTPYIVLGTLGAVLLCVLLPVADNTRSLPFFSAVLCAVLVCMSTYRSPAVALMPDVTPAPLRSKANAVINLMGAVGGILSLGLIAVLVPDSDPNYLPLFVCVAVLMLVCIIVLVAAVREPALHARAIRESRAMGVEMTDERDEARPTGHRLEPAARRSLMFMLLSVFFWFFGYNAVTTAFSKYAQVCWGLTGGSFAYCLLVAQGAAIVAFLPMGSLALRIGRKKTILLGVALLAAVLICAGSFKEFSPIVIVLFAFAGIGWAGINVNSYPLVVEMSRGADIGRYTGYYYTFSMLAQVITPIASGACLQFIGYTSLFPYAAIFVCLSFVTMLFVRHGDSIPTDAKRGLEVLDDLDT